MRTLRPAAAPLSELVSGAPPVRCEPSADADVRLASEIQRLVEKARSIDALRKHGLHLAAARLWRSRGREIPATLRSDIRIAAVRALLAPLILGKARSAYEGGLMLMKGPEVAAHYPVSSDRSFGDLDLLAEEPQAAQRALLEAGFVELQEPAAYLRHHHLPPLMWPGAPLGIEIHRRPSQPDWLPPVSAHSMFAAAVPSALGVPGLLAPEPAAHAVLVVAHAWNHDPLGNVRQLLDAAALLTSADRRRAGAFARAWGWERMWDTTLGVMDAVLSGQRRCLPLNLWARHVVDLRERTVLENHITRLAARFCGLPAAEVPRGVACALRHTLAPQPGSNWIAQLRHSCYAVAHAFTPSSAYEQNLLYRAQEDTPPRRQVSLAQLRR